MQSRNFNIFISLGLNWVIRNMKLIVCDFDNCAYYHQLEIALKSQKALWHAALHTEVYVHSVVGGGHTMLLILPNDQIWYHITSRYQRSYKYIERFIFDLMLRMSVRLHSVSEYPGLHPSSGPLVFFSPPSQLSYIFLPPKI